MGRTTTIEIAEGMTPAQVLAAMRQQAPHLFGDEPEPPPPAGKLAPEPLMTPGEVAAYFRVNPKTVTRWALEGKLACVRTPGGHRRYKESDVRAMAAGTPQRPAA